MPSLAILGVVLRMTTPILLAGTGSLYNDRAGVTNITLEGCMLISAFAAVVCSYHTGNWMLAACVALLVGILVSLAFYFLTAILGGDELVVGFSMNILLDGLSIFLMKQIFGKAGSIVSERILGIPLIKADWLRSIPIIGDMFNGQSFLVYAAFIIVLLTWVVLYRTPFGLNVLACGEQPLAVATVGTNVMRVRFACNLICGALCGLAGLQISLGFLTLFTQGMTVGRGFIALAATVFSKGNPIRLIGITLFFGLAEAISNQMQLMQLPSELVLALPYIAVVALTMIRLDKRRKTKVVHT
jgi:simple sugar transport system permease protein